MVVALPYIDVSLPRVYMCSPSWTSSHIPPHPIPLGHPSAPAPSTLSHALNLDWRSVSHLIIHMFQCHSLKSSYPCPLPTESKRLFYTSVSLLLSRIKGYCYHFSKFHIYALLLLLLFTSVVSDSVRTSIPIDILSGLKGMSGKLPQEPQFQLCATP